MPEIRYNFKSSGQASVVNAFASISKAALASARDVDKAYASTVVSAKKAAAQIASVDKKRREVQRESVRQQTVSARQEDRAKQKEERDTARQADRLLATERRSNERRQAMRTRLLRDQIRSGEQAGKAQAQLDERMRRFRDRHEQSELRKHQARIESARRSGARSGAKLGQHDAARASARGSLTGDLREALSLPSVVGVLGKIGSVIKGVALGAIGTAASVGIGVTGAATKDSLRTQEIANRVSINARLAGKEAIDPTTLRKEFEATAIANPGQTAAQIGQAVQAYITKTGDVGGARRFSGTFATVANATGSDVTDIANAAADISQKFDITGLKEMQDALAALTYQGKEGAFELSSAAEKFARMGSAASAFGFNKGVGGLKTLGGLSQIIQSSTGNADVTSTALGSMLERLVSQSGKIKKLTSGGGKKGVDVFTDKTHTKTNDIQSLLTDIIAGTGGDLVKLKDIFETQGLQGAMPLISTFNQARNAAVGKDGKAATEEERVAAGKAAVRAQLDKAINAPGDWSEVQKDAAQAQGDVTARLTSAWEKVVSIAGDKLLPVITELAERIADTPELFEAFKAALEALVRTFEQLGIIKAKTPEQLKSEAETKAAKAGGKAAAILLDAKNRGAEKLTADESKAYIANRTESIVAERTAKEIETLQKVRAGTATKEEAGSIRGLAQMSSDDIAATYLALGSKGGAGDKDKMAEYAKFIGASITSKNESDLVFGKGHKNVGATGVVETDEQVAFRQQWGQRYAVDSAKSGTGSNMEGVVAALREIAGAVKANAGNQPSTVSQ